MSKDNIYIDTEKRVVYFHTNVNEDTISKVNYWLLDVLRSDQSKEDSQKSFERKPIKFYINSYGGQIDSCFSLIDIMLKSKTPIYTYCNSYCASSGLKIFLAGSKRFVSKTTHVMMHQLSWGMNGKMEEMRETMEHGEYLNTQIMKYLMNRTNMTKEFIENVFKSRQDRYIYFDEMFELGIATDEIMEY